MAVNPALRYPSNSTPPDAAYTFGSARNSTVPGAKNGYPYEKDHINDILGFQQVLLDRALLTPSGIPDSVLASQYLEAVGILFLRQPDSVTELINKSFTETQARVISYHPGWAATVAGPKGGHRVHKTGADNIAPTIGAPVSVSTIGTGTQAGFYWDLDGDEWLISEDVVDYFMTGARGDWDGATGTDDQVAIQNAINIGREVYQPAADFLFSSQVVNPDVIPIYGPGRLFFDGSGEHAFIFGAADGSAHVYGSSVMSNIHLERTTQDFTDVFGGVCCFNTEGHQMIIHSRRFYYPLYMQGFDAGCVFNNYYIKLAGDGVSQILMHANGTSGFVNQNNIYGGRFFTVSSTSDALDITGVEWKTESSAIINGNTFYNPSFELFNIGAGVTQAFKGSGAGVGGVVAIKNKLSGGRLEATDFLLGGKGVLENEFAPTSTQFSASLSDQLLNPDTDADKLILMQNKFDIIAGDLGLDETKTVASLNKTNMVTQQPGGSELGCKPARGVIFEAAAVDQLVFHDVGVSLKHDSFVNNAPDTILGFLLDLRNVQEDYTKIITLKAITAATGGRFAAVCFDGSFNLLETTADCSLTFNGGNGLFRTGADITSLASEQKIAFGDNVDYAIVGVVQGSVAADLRSLEIFAIGRSDVHICYDTQAVTGITVKTVNSISVSPITDSDIPIATQTPLAPVAGNSYPPGLDVDNADPATTEADGWKFETGGSTFLVKAALT